jgi:aldehyde dehydrogenase (NAD+)
MSNHRKFYIDGKWVDPKGTETLDVINPATEEPIATIALGNEEDVNRAVAAAKKAFETFSRTTLEERAALLEKIIGAYKERMGEIAETVSKEMGAPMSLANAAQAPAGLGHLMYSLNALNSFPFEEQVGKNLIVREPIGVCGLITPWNWPLNQIAAKVGPAIAAGCTMVLKPSRSRR